jgi:hypothetical protein
MKIIINVILCLLTFFSLPIQAEKFVPPDSFTFNRFGHDREGQSMNETISVVANQNMEWTTASRGPAICPSSAGTFQVELSSDEFKTLQKQALEIIAEQKSIKLPATESDETKTISTMVVWQKGKDHYTAIKTWNDSLSNFNRALAMVQNKAKAKNAIEISIVKKNKKEFSVVFKKSGAGEFQLYLPAKANEVFHSDLKGDIQYAKTPTTKSIRLKDQESYSVNLKNIPSGASQLWYVNSVVKHHGDENMPDVSICAPIK